MRKIFNILIAITIVFASSCTYTFPEAESPTSGNADFSKVIAVGNSLTAGFMNGALYNDGQINSYANIVATQMQELNGGSFNQPDINSENGYFGLDGSTVLGRLHLVIPTGGTQEDAIPIPLPGDATGLNTPYTGPVNNFGVPGLRIVDAGVPGYGTVNPYFGRFASNPSTASVLGDAGTANGSFIIFWLGSNDVLGYATDGGSGNTEGSATNDMTSVADFKTTYENAVSTLFSNGQKGIIANIPNVQDIPYFTTVTWDAIEFPSSDPTSQPTIDALNSEFAGLNYILDTLRQTPFNLDSIEMVNRKVQYSLGSNPILIYDEDLTDIGPYLDQMESNGVITAEERQKLDPYVKSRPMNSSELVTLTAGSKLGTDAIVGVQSPIGVAIPIGDEFILTEAEQEAIASRIAEFNTIIATQASANSENIALLDINAIFFKFAHESQTINGTGINATILPPFGAFSLDGVHPNARGYAYVANLFIDKINESFGSNIPNVNPNDYSGNELPVP